MNLLAKAQKFRASVADNCTHGFVVFIGDKPLRWVEKLTFGEFPVGAIAVDGQGREQILLRRQFGQRWQKILKC